jgi:hypothetical protein
VSEPRKLDAYYYGFDPTGNDAVDAILEAVARAGKRCHYTEDWSACESDGRASPAQFIQDAANRAALMGATPRPLRFTATDVSDVTIAANFVLPFDSLQAGRLMKLAQRLMAEAEFAPESEKL